MNTLLLMNGAQFEFHLCGEGMRINAVEARIDDSLLVLRSVLEVPRWTFDVQPGVAFPLYNQLTSHIGMARDRRR